MDLVTQAIEADNARNYREAYDLYTQALEYLVARIKQEQNPKLKASLLKRTEEVMKRAEQLRALLGHDPTTTSTATASSNAARLLQSSPAPIRPGGYGAPRARDATRETFRTLTFLFGDENYPRDAHLQSLADAHGWIHIGRLVPSDDFKRLTQDCQGSTSTFRRAVLTAKGAVVMELDSFGQRIRRIPLRRRVALYLVHLFSWANWSRDLHLQVLAEGESGGFVPLVDLLDFPLLARIRRAEGLEGPAALELIQSVATSLQGEHIQLSADGSACRPVTLPARVRSVVERCLLERDAPARSSVALQDLPPPPSLSRAASSVGLESNGDVIDDLMGEDGGFIEIEDLILSLAPSLLAETKNLDVVDISRALRQSRVLECDAEGRRVRLCAAQEDQLRSEAAEAADAEGYRSLSSPPPLPPASPREGGGDAVFDFLRTALPRGTGDGFSLVSLNTLAQHLAPSHSYCPAQYLGWGYRQALLVTGICRVLPDVLCFQELEGFVRPPPPHSNRISCVHSLATALEPLGYALAAYAIKADSRGRCVTHRPDMGNAIFIRTESIELVCRGRVAYAQKLYGRCETEAEFAVSQHELPEQALNLFDHNGNPGSSFCQALRAHYTHGKQTMVWATLRHRASGKTFTVGNTHIACQYLNPDKQVAQLTVALEVLEAVRREQQGASPHGVILAGDFNSQPGAGPFNFCQDGELSVQDPDALPRELHLGRGLCYSRGPDGKFRHHLDLASTYPVDNTLVTTRTGGDDAFQGNLDYIWHTRQGLRPLARLPLPRPDQVAQGLPNRDFPSDHVPLGAYFALE